PEVRPSLVEGRDCISGKMNVAASPANYVRCMATDPDTDWWRWGAARGHGRFAADRGSPAPLSLSPSSPSSPPSLSPSLHLSCLHLCSGHLYFFPLILSLFLSHSCSPPTPSLLSIFQVEVSDS